MKRPIFFCSFLLLTVLISFGQNYFRSGIFLHHSTGACIWGPNGSSTSVPQEIHRYNTLHGYTGSQTIAMDEEWWASGDNEWVTQHAFFEDPNPLTGIGFYLPGNKIIVIKTCFPASAMSDPGQPTDTLVPEMKTVYNYKWHWRHIVRVMNEYPENFFVIWTNAPLEPASTNATEAALSKWFCTWANDTLAEGSDPEFGPFPANVMVFDFFRKLTGADGMMLSVYAVGTGDSHPNAAATTLVAPQFVTEIFNASTGYEVIYGIGKSNENIDSPITVYPNPCTGETVLRYAIYGNQKVEISLFDESGRMVKQIVDGYLPNGIGTIPVSLGTLEQGVYFARFIQGVECRMEKLLVIR